jgi:histidine triad (HIT) family protein
VSASDCLFCRILAGEVPSQEVLSTDEAYAFRDINPAAPTHVLVIPRRHVDNAHTLSPDDGGLLAALFQAAQEVARKEGVDESGYRLVFNVGEDAQNSIGHLHMHLVGGRRMEWPSG